MSLSAKMVQFTKISAAALIAKRGYPGIISAYRKLVVVRRIYLGRVRTTDGSAQTDLFG